MHLEFLLEEASAEALLSGILPKILPQDVSWTFSVFQGKKDLLLNLPRRLKGYRNWIPDDHKLVILIDEDRQDCKELKLYLDRAAFDAGLITKTRSNGTTFNVLNRIIVEELEAWYFGDNAALCAAYPRLSRNLSNKAAYRNSDTIAGGTWEALERILQSAGYFAGGLPKIQVAREIARHFDPSHNTSQSFMRFVSGLAAM